jgi:uncharacterized protein (DUF2345 family)
MAKSAQGIAGKAHLFKGKVKWSDMIEVEFVDEEGNAMANVEYVLILPDGKERKGTTDEDGYLREEDLRPGNVRIRLADGTPITIKKEESNALRWVSD